MICIVEHYTIARQLTPPKITCGVYNQIFFMTIISKYIVICSNKHPKDVYNKSEEDINQLLRRIDHILDFDDPVRFTQAQKLGNTIPASSSFNNDQTH